MSRLFIPGCGDRITVTQPWKFKLYLEDRNIAFAEESGHTIPPNRRWSDPLEIVDHVVQPGTVLECDRVYIRTNSKSAANEEDSYDSVTWKVVVNGKPVRKLRFWVKLSACADLEYDDTSISKYHDRQQP